MHAQARRRAAELAGPVERTDRAGALWLLIFAWLASTVWARTLAIPDEGRYASIALEMLRSDDWLTPRLDGLPYFHKPPLFYWITAGSLAAFGVHEWSVRLGSVVAACATGFALWRFNLRWGDARLARASLLVLMTQPLFVLGAQFANPDMLVAGCVCAAILLAAHAALCTDRGLPCRLPLAGAYACAGLGLLAKGLIGGVLPLLVMFGWLVLHRRLRLLWLLCWPPGLALFAMIALPWLSAMEVMFPGFLHYFFVHQQVQRYILGGFNNVEPAWFYVGVLALSSLPWMPRLLAGSKSGSSAVPASLSVRSLMTVWLLVVVVFFSIPRSKPIGYVLPAIPALAWLIADRAWGRDARSSAWSGLCNVSAILAAAACLGAVLYFSVHNPKSSKPLVAAMHRQRRSSEPIVFVDEYFHDVVFYARPGAPIPVAFDWPGAALNPHDDARHELLDAAGFAPGRAARTLVGYGELRRLLCVSRVSWVFAAPDAVVRHRFLALAAPVAGNPDAMLWRIDAQRPELAAVLDCAASSPR